MAWYGVVGYGATGYILLQPSVVWYDKNKYIYIYYINSSVHFGSVRLISIQPGFIRVTSMTFFSELQCFLFFSMKLGQLATVGERRPNLASPIRTLNGFKFYRNSCSWLPSSRSTVLQNTAVESSTRNKTKCTKIETDNQTTTAGP